MKYKQLVIGVLLGSMITGAGAAAASQSTTVSAFLKDGVLFKFNGKEKKLEDGYSVLNYKNATYVPARFVAEELGATVTWDNKTQTISINSSAESKGPTPSYITTKPAATEQQPATTQPSSVVTEQPKPTTQVAAREQYDRTWSNPDGSIKLKFSSDTKAEVEITSKSKTELNGLKFSVDFTSGSGFGEFSTNDESYVVTFNIVNDHFLDFSRISKSTGHIFTIIYSDGTTN